VATAKEALASTRSRRLVTGTQLLGHVVRVAWYLGVGWIGWRMTSPALRETDRPWRLLASGIGVWAAFSALALLPASCDSLRPSDYRGHEGERYRLGDQVKLAWFIFVPGGAGVLVAGIQHRRRFPDPDAAMRQGDDA
jgi:hypothetical protein